MLEERPVERLIYTTFTFMIGIMGLVYFAYPYATKILEEMNPEPLNKIQCWQNGNIINDEIVKGTVTSSIFKKDIIIFDKSGNRSIFTGDCKVTPVN